ncbi:MAG: histidine phosphatase family protein [Acidaminococcaceae bacterium]|nr:histidine phosphatase family protein [Acidaminococcaceae bacterium]
MKTKVILIRHGETEWNVLHRFQGLTDIPLNDRGRQQAGFARNGLVDRKLDAIYTSPLQRAVETAEIIRGDRDIPIYPTDGLREMGIGEWEGLLVSEIDEKYPGWYDIWRTAPTQIRLKGGEPYAETQKRAWKTFWEIVKKHEGQTVLIVSHMMCISSILLTVAGIPLDEVWQHPIGNAALNIVEADGAGNAVITAWSRDDHIPETFRLKQPFGRVK